MEDHHLAAYHSATSSSLDRAQSLLPLALDLSLEATFRIHSQGSPRSEEESVAEQVWAGRNDERHPESMERARRRNYSPERAGTDVGGCPRELAGVFDYTQDATFSVQSGYGGSGGQPALVFTRGYVPVDNVAQHMDKRLKNRESQRKYREKQKTSIQVLEAQIKQQELEIRRLNAAVQERNAQFRTMQVEKNMAEEHTRMLLTRVKELEAAAGQTWAGVSA